MDHVQGKRKIGTRLRVNRQHIRSAFLKALDIALRILDHQMDVKILDQRHSKGNTWHKGAVHDINMQPVAACLFDFSDLLTQPVEIRGEN